MNLNVFTLNWNKYNFISNHLFPSALSALNYSDMDFTWFVRDNGSKDQSVEYMQNQKNVEVFAIDHNRFSFAQGMNFLFEMAKPADEDYILLLNNDVFINDMKSIKTMINLMKESDADIVGARLLYGTGEMSEMKTPYFKFNDTLQHGGVIFGERYGRMPYHFRHQEKTNKFDKEHRYFQAVTAACMLVKVKAWKDVGGFSEEFKWAFDDIDLCLKIGQLRKNNIIYCGSTDIYHEESASLKKNPVNKMFLQHNVKTFKDKWFGRYMIDHDLYLKDPYHNVFKNVFKK